MPRAWAGGIGVHRLPPFREIFTESLINFESGNDIRCPAGYGITAPTLEFRPEGGTSLPAWMFLTVITAIFRPAPHQSIHSSKLLFVSMTWSAPLAVER